MELAQMTSLYNCRHDGDIFRITKFDSDWNVEASYLCDLVACECPAGHRPSCRHRQMLPKFIQREHLGDEWFFDFDRGGWIQGASKDLEPSLTIVTNAIVDEDEIELIEPSAIMGDGSPHMGGVNARVVAPAGLGQASEQRPLLILGGFPWHCADTCKTLDDCILNGCAKGYGSPSRENLHQPSPSPTPTIRRRV